jgi:hypothetical protein
MFKKVKRKSQHQTNKQEARFQEIKMQVLKGGTGSPPIPMPPISSHF